MSRIEETEIKLLGYRSEPFIARPSGLELHGDMLTWNWLPRKAGDPYYSAPVRGCLRALSRLPSATPARVLTFVRCYRVLALDPLVEKEQTDGMCFRRYTESIVVYTRLGAIIRRLLAVLDFLTRRIPLTKSTRCPVPDHPDMGQWMRDDMQGTYGLLDSEDYAPEDMRFALAGMVQDLWEASPPQLSTGTAYEEMPGLWVRFSGGLSAAGRWDDERVEAVRGSQHLIAALPGQGFFEWTTEEELLQTELPKKLVSYREYAETFAGLLPFMEEIRPSSLLSLLAFQLMEAITLPDDTYHCKQCVTEFQPALGKNAPRKDHGGCCSDNCRAAWKREYNKRLYQQRHAPSAVPDGS